MPLLPPQNLSLAGVALLLGKPDLILHHSDCTTHFYQRSTYSVEIVASLPPQNLPLAGVALVLGVQILGYTIFRGANGQKDQFRRDPNHPSVKHLKTLPTKRGTKLIISGWWGVARHINYFGDWLMGVAW